MTVAVSTVVCDGYPLELAFALIARAGGRAVEPAYIEGYVAFDETAFSEANATMVGQALAREGLSATAVSAHLDMGDADAAERLTNRLRFARQVGAGILITNTTSRERRDALSRTIEATLPICEDLGVVLALENPGQGEDLVIANAADGVALMNAFRSPWLRLNYDFGNVFTASDGLVHPDIDMDAALPFMAHAHVKDVLALPDEWRFTAIGEGSLDYRAIAAKLKQRCPDLPIGLELPLRLRRPGRRTPIRAPDALPIDAIEKAVRSSLIYWSEQTGRPMP